MIHQTQYVRPPNSDCDDPALRLRLIGPAPGRGLPHLLRFAGFLPGIQRLAADGHEPAVGSAFQVDDLIVRDEIRFPGRAISFEEAVLDVLAVQVLLPQGILPRFVLDRLTENPLPRKRLSPLCEGPGERKADSQNAAATHRHLHAGTP